MKRPFCFLRAGTRWRVNSVEPAPFLATTVTLEWPEPGIIRRPLPSPLTVPFFNRVYRLTLEQRDNGFPELIVKFFLTQEQREALQADIDRVPLRTIAACPYCGTRKTGRALRCHIQACSKRNQPINQGNR